MRKRKDFAWRIKVMSQKSLICFVNKQNGGGHVKHFQICGILLVDWKVFPCNMKYSYFIASSNCFHESCDSEQWRKKPISFSNASFRGKNEWDLSTYTFTHNLVEIPRQTEKNRPGRDMERSENTTIKNPLRRLTLWRIDKFGIPPCRWDCDAVYFRFCIDARIYQTRYFLFKCLIIMILVDTSLHHVNT